MQKIVFHEHTPPREAVAYIRLRRERFCSWHANFQMFVTFEPDVTWACFGWCCHIRDMWLNKWIVIRTNESQSLKLRGFPICSRNKVFSEHWHVFEKPWGCRRCFHTVSWTAFLMCVLCFDEFRVCSNICLVCSSWLFYIFSLNKTVGAAHPARLCVSSAHVELISICGTTFFKYKVLMTYTHLRVYMHTCIRPYGMSLKLLWRNHEQRHTRVQILNGCCLHCSKNTTSGGSGGSGGGSHSSALWLLQLKQQVSAGFMYDHAHLKNDSTCRWDQVFLDVHSLRWKGKKTKKQQQQQVNKQTKTETKGEVGETSEVRKWKQGK